MKRLSLFSTLICFLLFPINAVADPSPHRVNFAVAELKNIQGHYSSIYGHIYIRVKGKHVSTRYDGKYIELIKKSNGHFYPRYKFLWVFPINIGNISFSMKKIRSGKVRILMHEKNRTKVIAQKFLSKPVPQAWKKRLGNYTATQLKGRGNIKKVRLGMQNSILVAFINGQKSPYPLIAHSNTQLISPSAGHNHERAIRISLTKDSILLNYENSKLELKKQ